MILFSPEYIEYTLMGIILLPGIIFSIITSAKVNSTFNKYNQVLSSKMITGAECVKRILAHSGISNVQVVRSGDSELVDNFNPSTNVITLSSRVYDGTTISALGVAAHETGHAIQYAKNYAPIKIRTVLAKTSTVISNLVWPLILMGIIFNFALAGGLWGNLFLWLGVGFFGLSLIFSLITLPVELDASKRALTLLVETGCVDEMEVKGAKKVLSSAALTYVAAIVVSVLELLRFLLFFIINSKKDD